MTVSVVIPAYNADDFIEDAVRSVLIQDFHVDEIIIVNDGSSDRAYDDLEQLAPQIKVVHQSNRGVSAARNLGCKIARSDYVAILDADDVWLPGKLRLQLEHLSAHPNIDAVFCRGVIWRPRADDDNRKYPQMPHGSGTPDPTVSRLLYRDFLTGIPVSPSSLVVKKTAWNAIGGFDEGRRYAEDQDFYLRLCRRFNADLLRTFAVLYRQHSGNATTKLQDANHWADVIKDSLTKFGLGDEFGNRADAQRVSMHLSRIHFLHGYNHFWHGRIDIARREFRFALGGGWLRRKYLAYYLITRTPGLSSIVRRWQSFLRSVARRSAAVERVADDNDKGVVESWELP